VTYICKGARAIIIRFMKHRDVSRYTTKPDQCEMFEKVNDYNETAVSDEFKVLLLSFFFCDPSLHDAKVRKK